MIRLLLIILLKCIKYLINRLIVTFDDESDDHQVSTVKTFTLDMLP
jgi:hypothetical protein